MLYLNICTVPLQNWDICCFCAMLWPHVRLFFPPHVSPRQIPAHLLELFWKVCVCGCEWIVSRYWLNGARHLPAWKLFPLTTGCCGLELGRILQKHCETVQPWNLLNYHWLTFVLKFCKIKSHFSLKSKLIYGCSFKMEIRGDDNLGKRKSNWIKTTSVSLCLQIRLWEGLGFWCKLCQPCALSC